MSQEKPRLFNLIIFASEMKRVNYLQSISNQILRRYPCQVIFIRSEGAANESLKIEKIHISDDVDYEEVVIDVRKESQEVLLNALYPYVISDTPLIMLWGGDPGEENPLLSHLSPYCSRLIFDSEGRDQLELFAKQVLKQMQTLKCEVFDLNWLRLKGWRNVFLQVFNSPEKIELIKKSKKVFITYNQLDHEPASHHETQARYLQAWLGCQLQWKFKSLKISPSLTEIEYTCGNKMIDVELKSIEDQQFKDGSIVSIETISFDEQSYDLFRKANAPEAVFVHVSTNETCNLPFTVQLSNPQLGYTFSKEILYAPTSPSYKALLHALKEQKSKG